MALSFGEDAQSAWSWFFHIPRTGGNYTIRTVRGLRIGGQKIFMRHKGHAHGHPMKYPPHNIRRCFTIVRPPLDWYRSFYRFRIVKHYVGSNMAPGHELDKYIWSGQHQNGGHIYPFEDFVRAVQGAYPDGYVCELYCKFIRYVDKILSTDNLATELPALLASWGFDTPVTVPPIKKNATTDIQGNWRVPKQFKEWVARGHPVDELPVDLSPDAKALMATTEYRIINWLTDRRVIPWA